MSEILTSKKLKGKDLITIGIFSAIYFVINFIFMILSGINPILWMLMPALIAVFAGIPFMLMITRVQKPGAIFLMGLITALKEEAGHIRDAMKLRNIHGAKKIEYLLIPTMISATTTAEELSAAAVTRGIENPAPKTSMLEMKFSIWDFLCLAVGVVFCTISITVG